MSLKLDLLLEAINEIDKEDVIEESAGKNGLIERAAYEKYKALKKKNDEYDKKRDQYIRAGYEDKAPKPTDRKYEKDALETYNIAKRNRYVPDYMGINRDYRRGGDMEDYTYNTITSKTTKAMIDNMRDRNSGSTSSVNKRINARAEQKKAMGESVEDHIVFADTLLELLD